MIAMAVAAPAAANSTYVAWGASHSRDIQRGTREQKGFEASD